MHTVRGRPAVCTVQTIVRQQKDSLSSIVTFLRYFETARAGNMFIASCQTHVTTTRRLHVLFLNTTRRRYNGNYRSMILPGSKKTFSPRPVETDPSPSQKKIISIRGPDCGWSSKIHEKGVFRVKTRVVYDPGKNDSMSTDFSLGTIHSHCLPPNLARVTRFDSTLRLRLCSLQQLLGFNHSNIPQAGKRFRAQAQPGRLPAKTLRLYSCTGVNACQTSSTTAE